MPFIKTRNLTLYLEESGPGRPVLHISGTAGDLRNRPNVLNSPLAKHRHVIAYDQRGLGQSEKPNGPYSMAQYADDAAMLLDVLGIERADVVGASFGGMVAQHLALRHPERIYKLVLCCTSPGGDLASFPFHDLPNDLGPAERLLRLLPVSDTRMDAAWQAKNPEIVARLQQRAKDDYISDHATADFRRGARLQLEARKHHDTNAELHRLHMPTFICAGRYDGIARKANQERLHSRIEGSVLKWYEGGHLFLIQDKSAWTDIIEFLG
ncbi:MAG: alpha/beta fold hydrolase [Pseudomonadales bacterium]